MTKADTIEAIKKKLEDLPLIDATVMKLLSLLDDIDSDYQQIIGRLSPEIAVKFLNMASSAFYGTEVRSIDYAVRVLGFSGMKQILTTSVLIDQFSKGRYKKIFDFNYFQEHARCCASVSRALGEILKYNDPAELFTVSMLHNIGELIIAVYFGEARDKIDSLIDSKGISISEAEREILGLSHADVGALVLKRFNLSQDICDAVRYHDLENRIIPEGSNYHMELISREAVRIVERLDLPQKVELTKLTMLLEDIVLSIKETYLAYIRSRPKTDNNQKAFEGIFEPISLLVSEKIETVFNPAGTQL
jgi:HD-like signal output (HDOD) protein